MKRTAIIISAILAGAMAVPTAAAAKNNYPTFPPVLSDEEKEALTDEEKAERIAQNKAAQEELVRAYKNGEYDWDFNIDGAIDFTDASFVMWRYVEFSTTTELLNITPIQRAKIDEEGDINGDGLVNAIDAALMLKVFSETREKGDLNLDGMLDSKDASMILRYYSLQSTGSRIDEVLRIAAETKGDANGDGIIDASDASYVLAKYSRRATE